MCSLPVRGEVPTAHAVLSYLFPPRPPLQGPPNAPFLNPLVVSTSGPGTVTATYTSGGGAGITNYRVIVLPVNTPPPADPSGSPGVTYNGATPPAAGTDITSLVTNPIGSYVVYVYAQNPAGWSPPSNPRTLNPSDLLVGGRLGNAGWDVGCEMRTRRSAMRGRSGVLIGPQTCGCWAPSPSHFSSAKQPVHSAALSRLQPWCSNNTLDPSIESDKDCGGLCATLLVPPSKCGVGKDCDVNSDCAR